MPCRADLPWQIGMVCTVCAVPLPGGTTCGHCLSHPPAFSHTLAAFHYAFPIDALIHACKYGGNLVLFDLLAEPLATRALAQRLPDLLVPMPLHPHRIRERGFNQAREIAAVLSRRLKVPLVAQGCHRIHNTPPQAALKLKERAANLRDAFECDASLRGKRIALIDDVMTSGASLNALALAARRQGAEEVEAWVVARTPPRGWET